jgi:2-C-methyl-D-erythritol 4-phosphate cytidylyltransferase
MDPGGVTSEPESVRAAAVVVAAGSSQRMGDAPARKPLIEIEGRSMLAHVCAAFDAAASIAEIVVVAHPEDVRDVAARCSEVAAFAKVRAVVPGGGERFESVRLGVAAVDAGSRVVAVHDAARPLVTAVAIERTVRMAAREGAALLAVPVRDTVKESADGRRVVRTLDRARLWAAQTPQAFELARFRELCARAAAEGLVPTDDAALWERYVGPVPIVEGEPSNFKITTLEDLELARALFARRTAETPA